MMSNRETEVHELIQRGDKLLRQGDLDAAEKVYLQASNLDNNSVDAYYSIGCVYSHRQDFETAKEYAEKALKIDTNHTDSRLLLGNCLLGLKQYADAKREFVLALEGKKPIPAVLGQIGLCCEEMGELEEAEYFLRQALETDPSYITRFQFVGWYAYSALAADLHHFLARVLQRLGKVEEAKLHYHLSKRNDATIELDPMYRKIMTNADLENHPFFDQPAAQPEEGIELLIWLTKQDDYKTLQKSLKAIDSNKILPELVGAIHATQLEGYLSLSAKLRIVGDELHEHNTTERLFIASRSFAWKLIFEITERIFKKELTEEESQIQLRSLVQPGPQYFDWDSAPLLLDLTNRFIEVDYRTGLVLASIVEKLLMLGPSIEYASHAKINLGKALARSGNIRRAQVILADAIEKAQQNNLLNLKLKAMRVLIAFNIGGGYFDEALNEINEYLDCADKNDNTHHVAQVQIQKIDLLLRLKRFDEAYVGCMDLLEWDTIARGSELQDTLRFLIDRVTKVTGRRIPDELLKVLEKTTQNNQSARELFHQAHKLASEGKTAEAIELLNRLEDLSWVEGNRIGVAQALLLKGQLLASQEKLEAASEELAKALRIVDPLTSEFDVWPILFELAQIAYLQEQFQESISFLERALTEARYHKEEEQEQQTLRALSMVLLKVDPERAIAIFGESMRLESSKETLPNEWQEAEIAIKIRDFEGAINAYERLCAHSGEHIERLRPLAIANIGIAKLELNRIDDAISDFREASSLFEKQGETRRAAECMARVVIIGYRHGKASYEELDKLLQYAYDQQNSGSRRNTLVIAGSTAFEIGAIDKAEVTLLDALALATSNDWKDTRDELSVCHSLGKLYRHRMNYAKALVYYQQALKCALNLSDGPAEAAIRGNMGIALRYLDRLDEAVEQYMRAIEFGDRSGDSALSATHRLNLSSALFLLGHNDRATKVAIEAVHLFIKKDEFDGTARCLAMLDQYAEPHDIPSDIQHLLVGQFFHKCLVSTDDVVRSWAESKLAQNMLKRGDINQARSIIEAIGQRYKSIGDRYNQAQAYIGWSRMIMGDHPEEAKKYALKGRRIANSINQLLLQTQSNSVLLHCYIQLKDDKSAERSFTNLLKQWRQARLGLYQEQDRIRFADKATELIDQYATYKLIQGYPNRAVEIQDLGRSQTLFEFNSANTKTATISIKKMRNLLSHVPREVVLLSFGWVGNVLVVFALTSNNDEVKVHNTGVTRQDVLDLYSAYDHEVIKFRGEGASSWKYRAAPLLSEVSRDIPKDSLVFLMLEEELQSLPIHAVPLPDGNSLLSRAAVAYVPSMQFLHHASKPKQNFGKHFVSAGVTFQDEVLAILQRFGAIGVTGNQLDKLHLEKMFKDARIIHIACHGYFDPDNYLESGLVITDTTEPLAKDVLSVRELKNWNLKADLAVLSACETGRGLASASDFLNLGRAFLGTGVRSVITSLWDVENSATQKLMLDFYGQLFGKSKGHQIDIAESLRQAQLHMAQQGQFCDWAAFKLTGWPFTIQRREGEFHGN